MVDEAAQSEEFNSAVAQDRAAMIREAAKQNKQKSKKADALQATSTMSGKASKKVLDKLLLTANNSIWGLSIIVIPLLGLTLLLSLMLIFALLLKGLFTERLKEKGISIEVSLWAQMYTWGTLLVQLLLTVIVYSIIYIILNPVDFGLNALGL